MLTPVSLVQQANKQSSNASTSYNTMAHCVLFLSYSNHPEWATGGVLLSRLCHVSEWGRALACIVSLADIRSPIHLVRRLRFPQLNRNITAVTSGCITTCSCLLPVFTALAFQPSHGERKVQHSHSVILRNPLHRTPSIINQNYGIITRLGFLSWFFVFLKKKAFLKIMAHPRQKQEHPHGNRIQISIPGSQNTCFRALLNVGTGGSCSSLGAFLFFSYSFPGWFYSSLRDSRWWWRWILGYYRKWHFIWGNLFDFNFMHIWSQKIRMRIKKNIYLSI